MNIAKLLFCCFFCAALVFAQQPSEHPFNTLRGFAYNPYGTLGAAPSIADILRMPSDIYGHKFVYVSPVSNLGYSAFDLAGGSALLGFNQSLILGYAKSFYGLSFEISPDKSCVKIYDDYECRGNADHIGLNFSVPLGNSTLYAHTGRTTAENNRIEDNSDFTSKNSTKEMSIGITGGNIMIWDFRLGLDRIGVRAKRIYYDYEESGIVESDLIMTEPNFQFKFGYKILQSDRVKFIVGLSNWCLWRYMKNEVNYSYFYTTEEESYSSNTHYMYIRVSPNFLGEVVLTKHLLAFAGARHIISYDMSLYEDYSSNTEIRSLSIRSFGSDAYVGLRYGHKNWAVETRLQSDAFGEVLSGNNPFISLGGFIWLVL
jgi:hypothetical protein